MRENALLVTVDFGSANGISDPAAASRELEELCVSAGLAVADSLLFRQKEPSSALLLGKGKAEKVRERAKEKKADVVIFHSSLSSSQQRNLEEIVDRKTIDRTQLILDIFASRAKSTEGKLQVELAQLRYLLPRLTGKGIYLSRLGGGVGTRGPGEQKLEVDRRRIRQRITKLSRELQALQKRRLASLDRKKEKEFPLLAFVGYTNAGKSSLFNALTRSSLFVKDQLFSTLDTTTRLLALPGSQKALLVDTVGFLRDLPHHLIESFKATLEEVVYADILLHVIDASRPDKEALEAAVREVLSDLGAQGKKTLLLLNKVDLLAEGERQAIGENLRWNDGVFVSALTGEGLDKLLSRLAQLLGASRRRREFFIPKERLKLAGILYDEAEVLERQDEEDGSYFTVNISERFEEAFTLKLSKP
ncbi:MAG: GTPase HflX [Candidatus Omnitrophica bacterium]|nr:GTPase HflX [Candidatus Omnitrophota bacterium]